MPSSNYYFDKLIQKPQCTMHSTGDQCPNNNGVQIEQTLSSLSKQGVTHCTKLCGLKNTTQTQGSCKLKWCWSKKKGRGC